MSQPTTSRVPSHICRGCGSENDAATREDDHRPSPGDISLCGYCRTISIFDDDLGLREPTASEWEELAKHPDLKRYTDASAEAWSG